MAIDDLKSRLADVDALKTALSDSNSRLQSVTGPLLSSLDARTVSVNVDLTLRSLATGIRLIEVCARSNHHLSNSNLYMVLKCLDSIKTEFLQKTPSSTLRRMLEKKISVV
ncbi:hypothetical protein SLA2020_439020 [Shorea laevis]